MISMNSLTAYLNKAILLKLHRNLFTRDGINKIVTFSKMMMKTLELMGDFKECSERSTG